jgi:hypothetical protein
MVKPGDRCLVPAVFWGNEHAKREWGKDWKTAVEGWVVKSKHKDNAKVWVCKSEEYVGLLDNIHEKDILKYAATPPPPDEDEEDDLTMAADDLNDSDDGLLDLDTQPTPPKSKRKRKASKPASASASK